jgi:hypothetical protein
MSLNEDIRKALRNFMKSSGEKYGKVCTAINVSCDTVQGMMLCDCVPLDGSAVIEDVRIVADFNTNSTTAGIILVPSENSIVIVNFINSTTAYLAMVSEVDNIYLDGNNYGGLVKVIDLTTKLNNLELLVNKLVTALNTWTPVSGDGGAALKTLIIAASPVTLTPTVRANIESTFVKHGDSNLI